MEMEETQIAKTISKRNKDIGVTLADFSTNYKATVIKRVWHSHK